MKLNNAWVAVHCFTACVNSTMRPYFAPHCAMRREHGFRDSLASVGYYSIIGYWFRCLVLSLQRQRGAV